MTESRFDVVVVGAGFAGMYMLHKLRGLGMSAVVFEAATDVGGTWYWNRYPGARCDIESMQYSYSFDAALEQEWSWSERFAAQPEILSYAQHVADRFDLRRDIRFETRVTAAAFDEATDTWLVTTDRGDAVRAPYLVMATGCLSSSRVPDIAGLETFRGETYHTGQWPHEPVDLAGKRIAVVGTGSSGIQSIPVLADLASQLTVFQRTPNYSIPSRNEKMTPEYDREWKSSYPARRAVARFERGGTIYDVNPVGAMEVSAEERQREYAERWQAGGIRFMSSFNDIGVNAESNLTMAEFVRERIREMVKDPQTAELLAPKTYPIGAKRICVDSHYFETFNRDNVELVDLHTTPIEAVTPDGIRTSATEYKVDAIVFATGFDAMTGAMARIDIKGCGGLPLTTKWEAGPRTYLGLMTAGFPNMFMITGPGSPSVLSNMIVSIEQHVDFIADCLSWMRDRGLGTMEAEPAAEDAWVEHVNEVAYKTLHPQANSWYLGANIPGKPRVFMPYIGGVGVYREKCDAVAANGYEGFRIAPAPAVSAAAE